MFADNVDCLTPTHLNNAVAHEDGAQLVERLSIQFDLTEQQTISIIAEVQEALAPSDRAGTVVAHFLRMVKRGLREVLRSRTYREMAHKLRYYVLAMGWFDLLDGVDNPTDLGRTLRVTKANANKFVNLFRDILPDGMKSLPNLGGQRTEAERAKFAGIRKQQEAARA
jgi:hypothetical protein